MAHIASVFMPAAGGKQLAKVQEFGYFQFGSSPPGTRSFRTSAAATVN
jgi:hypothetical protein